MKRVMNDLIQKGGLWLVLLGVMAIFVACQPITPNGTSPNAPAPATAVPNSTGSENTDVPAAHNQRQVLALQLGLDLDAVEIVEVEAVTWSDGCLGLGSPVELCLQAETPGYRITLMANGEEYAYHTNEDGSQVRLASAPEPQLEHVLLEATLNDESGCNTVQVSRDQIAFGRCMTTLLSVPILDPARQADIAEFAETFAPFSATVELGTATEFVAGDLQFNGTGTQAATPAQQRMIAEWARLLWLEAQSGRSGASWGLALAWHREGGIAGFCDDVTVYVTGAVYVTSCRGQQATDLGQFRLDTEQLTMLYDWIDTYASFEVEQRDPAVADSMTVRLIFSGAGAESATEAEQQEILDFAQMLLTEVEEPADGEASDATAIPTAAPATDTDPTGGSAVAESLRAVLAMQLRLVADEITVVDVEAVTWSDGCLGLGSPVESCIMAETPGYQITLAANGAAYLYHTDADGTQVRLAAAPEPQLNNVLIEMTLNEESGCNTIQISSEQLAFGRCMSTMMSAPLTNPDRQAELAEFAATFAPFTVETAMGSVQFNGSGPQAATPAQQRMIAEWAQLVASEVRFGSAGPNAGLIFAWHREGGIAGFCDDLVLVRTGEAFPSSCKGQGASPESFRLTADELAQIYAWVDTYAAFQYEWRDPAAADALAVTLDFFGTGTEAATEPEQVLIVDFAQNLFTEGKMAATEAPAGCPQPDANQQLLMQEVEGYCLLYPAAYSLWQQNPGTMEIISDTIMNHIDPRVSITVEDAAGRTLDEVVDGLLADYAPPGFDILPQAITLAGVEATLLDEVPGQDLTRRLVVIENGRLYSFFFAPIGDAGTTTREAAEALYSLVIGSFHLL